MKYENFASTDAGVEDGFIIGTTIGAAAGEVELIWASESTQRQKEQLPSSTPKYRWYEWICNERFIER